jgi:Flp pilus assembly pilin Flp
VVTGLPERASPERRIVVDRLRQISMQAYLALRGARDREEGQALVEYALVLFLVAVVCIVILGTLGNAVSSMFSKVTNGF